MPRHKFQRKKYKCGHYMVLDSDDEEDHEKFFEWQSYYRNRKGEDRICHRCLHEQLKKEKEKEEQNETMDK